MGDIWRDCLDLILSGGRYLACLIGPPFYPGLVTFFFVGAYSEYEDIPNPSRPNASSKSMNRSVVAQAITLHFSNHKNQVP